MISRLVFWSLPPLLSLLVLGALRAKSPDSLAQPAADLTLATQGEQRATAHAHYLAARQLEGEGRMREALEHYLGFLKLGLGDPPLVAHIAAMTLNYRGFDEALQVLQTASQAHQTRPEPLLNLAQFAFMHARDQPRLLDLAHTTAARALTLFPHDPEVYATVIRMHLAQNQHPPAVLAVEQGLKQEVSSPDFWLALGRAAQDVWPLADSEKRQDHLTKINRFYDRAWPRAQAARSESAALAIADFYLFSNQLPKSAAICEELVQRHGSLDARKRLVRLYEAMERPADSLTALEALVLAFPRDVEHRKLLANEYVQKQEVDKAVEQLEASLQLGGGDLNEYLQLSNLLRFTKQTEKFDHFTRRAQRLYPGEPRVGYYRALALNAVEKHQEAAQLFEQVAREAETMAPELLDDRFYFTWGAALERGGSFAEAAKHLEKSIELTPPEDLERAAITMNYLGYMWLERNEHLDRAGVLIRKANELEPNSASYVDSLGWLLFKEGKPAEALTELLRAQSLLEERTKEDAEILDHIAQAYEQLGQMDKARECWQQALDLKPDKKEIRQRAEKALGIEKPEATQPGKVD